MPALPFKKKPLSDIGAPEPVGEKPPKKAPPLSARNNAQETPDEETSFHDAGQAPAPTPESVLYHGEQERCDGCEYFADGDCKFLAQQVDAGGHCQRYEAAGEDMGEESGADLEPEGGEAAEYGR